MDGKPSFSILVSVTILLSLALAGALVPQRALAFDAGNPASSGYQKVFDEEFTYPDTSFIDFTGQGSDALKLWHARLWYEGAPGASFASNFSIANGILTITNASLTTISGGVPSSGGGAWRQGYFEARINGNDWYSFWLMSLLHAEGGQQISSNPLTCTSELDIFEGDEGAPTTYSGTLHRDTSDGCGIPDQFNTAPNNFTQVGVTLPGAWHTYGALWTGSTVTWYLDGNAVATFPVWDSTNQLMWMVLGVTPGGIFGGPTVNPISMQVDWVHVWQIPGQGSCVGGSAYCTAAASAAPPAATSTSPDPALCSQIPTGSFVGCYYNGTNFNTLAFIQPAPAINFNWGGGSPDPSVSVDNFSARWQGNFNVTAGTYTFTTVSDDGVRLYVDNSLLIDDWRGQAATKYTATTTLSAGLHTIKLEYYEAFGLASVTLNWTSVPLAALPVAVAAPAAASSSVASTVNATSVPTTSALKTSAQTSAPAALPAASTPSAVAPSAALTEPPPVIPPASVSPAPPPVSNATTVVPPSSAAYPVAASSGASSNSSPAIIASVVAAPHEAIVLTRPLSFGMKDPEVAQLQQFLVGQNLLAGGDITGYFGALTRAAVERYQCDSNIVCSGNADSTGYGVAGPKTIKAITGVTIASVSAPAATPVASPPTPRGPSLSYGETGPSITTLQNLLIAEGYLPQGDNSGYFGPLTQTAVAKFQCVHNIICYGDPVTTGYGNVGPRTRGVLGL